MYDYLHQKLLLRVGLQGCARLFLDRCLFSSVVFTVNELSSDREAEQVAGLNCHKKSDGVGGQLMICF